MHYNRKRTVVEHPLAHRPPLPMPHAHAYGDVIHDAERAAAAGDFAGAETLLRQALELQERQLGTAHPELASTLNNLAVVCETNGRLDDAEQFYRRACAVATAALPPGDALVETSRANLEDFCRAHGRPVDDWPEIGRPSPPVSPAAAERPRPRAVEPSATDAPASPAPSPAQPAGVRQAAAPTALATTPRSFVTALVALAAAGTVTLAWFVVGPREPVPAETAAPAAVSPGPAETSATQATTTPPAVEAAPTTGAAQPQAAAPPPPEPSATVEPKAPPPSRAVEPPRPEPATSAVAPPARVPEPDPAARLVESDVCVRLTRDGRRWICEPAGESVRPGAVAFYTRVALARAARVEHRWYRNDALARAITLSVGASVSDGYRTFSQQTVTPGRWRVEARTADGRVLGGASFEVRE